MAGCPRWRTRPRLFVRLGSLKEILFRSVQARPDIPVRLPGGGLHDGHRGSRREDQMFTAGEELRFYRNTRDVHDVGFIRKPETA